MKLRLLAAALVLLAGCSTLDPQPAYLVGGWGGPHIGVTFSGGLADVRYDCASGSVDEAVYPAKDGTFLAKGTYREGATGPVRVGQIYRAQPATYSGVVTEGVMTLNVELDDGNTLGPFALSLGAPSQITRCL
jgi:hypothetical protein